MPDVFSSSGGLVVAHRLLLNSHQLHQWSSGRIHFAIDVTRVQFPADAFLAPLVLSWFCGSVLVFFKLPPQD